MPRYSVQFDDSAPQSIAIVIAPENPANAALAVAPGADCTLYTAARAPITGFDEIPATFDPVSRRLYVEIEFPAGDFPLGFGYLARFRYAVIGGEEDNPSAPEGRQEAWVTFDIVKSVLRPQITQVDVWRRQPRFADHSFFLTPEQVAAFIADAWDQLLADIASALRDSPHALVVSGAVREAHLLLSIALCFDAVQVDSAAGQAAEYRRRYRAELDRVLSEAPRDPGASTGVPAPAGSIFAYWVAR